MIKQNNAPCVKTLSCNFWKQSIHFTDRLYCIHNMYEYINNDFCSYFVRIATGEDQGVTLSKPGVVHNTCFTHISPNKSFSFSIVFYQIFACHGVIKWCALSLDK